MTHALAFLLGCAATLAAIYVVRRVRDARLEHWMDAAELEEERLQADIRESRARARREYMRWN